MTLGESELDRRGPKGKADEHLGDWKEATTQGVECDGSRAAAVYSRSGQPRVGRSHLQLIWAGMLHQDVVTACLSASPRSMLLHAQQHFMLLTAHTVAGMQAGK